jgi:hypothetical protein
MMVPVTIDGWPNREALLPRLDEILARTGVSAELDSHRIDVDGAAKRERFLGSHTVRINGRDVEQEAERRSDRGLKCRLYPASTGLSGQPGEELQQAALPSAAGAIGLRSHPRTRTDQDP